MGRRACVELADEVERLDVFVNPDQGTHISCLQLVELKTLEDKLRSVLAKRAQRDVASLAEDWARLLTLALGEGHSQLAETDERSRQATTEQASALEALTTRRLSVLVGQRRDGQDDSPRRSIEVRPPRQGRHSLSCSTGKARVRLGQKTAATAMTVAQFLYQLGRYDGVRQRPSRHREDLYRKERTVVIDECSMLTLEDLAAVLFALDMAHVERLILVGDPNQLPPSESVGPLLIFSSISMRLGLAAIMWRAPSPD